MLGIYQVKKWNKGVQARRTHWMAKSTGWGSECACVRVCMDVAPVLGCRCEEMDVCSRSRAEQTSLGDGVGRR